MSSNPSPDELAGTEQPFVSHLIELRDRLLWAVYGVGAIFALLLGPFVGHMLDRYGSRRIGISAVVMFFIAYSMLALTGVGLFADAARHARDTVDEDLKARQQTWHAEGLAVSSQQRRVHDLELERSRRSARCP